MDEDRILSTAPSEVTGTSGPEAVTVDEARARAIRLTLPGQAALARRAEAEAAWGTLYTLEELRRQVRATLPPRLGRAREAIVESIEAYRSPIPDDALLKYDDALRTGLFSRFFVATPAYDGDRAVDPWIVGELKGAPLYAIVAQWDV
jgi:hypothetical protein